MKKSCKMLTDIFFYQGFFINCFSFIFTIFPHFMKLYICAIFILRTAQKYSLNLWEKSQIFCMVHFSTKRKQMTSSTVKQSCPLRCTAVISLLCLKSAEQPPAITKGHSSPGLGAIVMLSDSERQKSMLYWLTLNGGSAQLICEVYPQEQEILVRKTHMQHFAVALLCFSFMCFPSATRAVCQVSHRRWLSLTLQLTEWNGTTRGCVLVSQHAMFISSNLWVHEVIHNGLIGLNTMLIKLLTCTKHCFSPRISIPPINQTKVPTCFSLLHPTHSQPPYPSPHYKV